MLVLIGLHGGDGPVGTWLRAYDGQWFPHNGPAPPARQEYAAAFDVASEEVLFFGGWKDGVPKADTWTFDGDWWRQRTPAHSPPARARAVASPAAGPNNTTQVLLFGGIGTGQRFDDQWSWNGKDWTPVTPAHSPGSRHWAAAAYEPRSARTYLFGGFDQGFYLNDLWYWDGVDWTAVPRTGPPQTALAAMSANNAGGITIFGGDNVASAGQGMWSFDGTSWSRRVP